MSSSASTARSAFIRAAHTQRRVLLSVSLRQQENARSVNSFFPSSPHIKNTRRLFHSTPTTAMSSSSPEKEEKPDWSAEQYLKFAPQRNRAVYDLVAQLPSLPTSGARIVDLGCGPGNSTAVLRERFPSIPILGVDSSPDMLSRARQANIRGAAFVQGDVRSWEPPSISSSASAGGDEQGEQEKGEPATVDLYFSNAVLHWLRKRDRLPTVQRLLRSQKPGGVFAFQVPDNRQQPSHFAMRHVAYRLRKEAVHPWAPYLKRFRRTLADEEEDSKRPDLDAIESAEEIYDALMPLCARVDVWRTSYHHVLPGHRDIVEWVKGTGLQPFLNALPPDGTGFGEGDGEGEDGKKGGESVSKREAFLAAYQEKLEKMYPRMEDGNVMLKYPRVFVVAVRK